MRENGFREIGSRPGGSRFAIARDGYIELSELKYGEIPAPRGPMIEKKCPVCFSSVANNLLRCPYCGWDFPPAPGEMLEAAKWLSDRITEARRLWRVNSLKEPGVEANLDRAALLRMTPPPPGPGLGAGSGPGSYRAVRPAPPDLRLVKGGPFLPVNSLGMEFVPIEQGACLIGAPEEDPEARDYERPSHLAVITKSFGLGRHQVTQEQWERVMGYNPSLFKGPSRPVESVTWEECCQFVRKLNLGEKGDLHRLPTEAEWEYCARCGSNDLDRQDDLRARSWFSENSNGQTWPVGRKLPNPWGLHDMLGNVWEWVFDWYGDYPDDPKTDPLGPAEGTDKVIRGGAWGSSRTHCLVFTRSVKSPGERSPLIGLRLVRDKALNSNGRFSIFHGWGR